MADVSRRELLTGAVAVAAAGSARSGEGSPDTPRAAPPAGFNRPMRFEANVFDCEVIGKIPTDLAGAYVRVGPEWYFSPKYPDDGIIDGDGYLIGVAANLAEMRSELVIADAQHLADGDVARVILPFRSGGLHGLWIGDDELDFGA